MGSPYTIRAREGTDTSGDPCVVYAVMLGQHEVYSHEEVWKARSWITKKLEAERAIEAFNEKAAP
jgi:hypothetical protein